MTARREFGGVIAACVIGAGLVLLAVRQGWARVQFAAPAPLPSGSVRVSGQNLLPGAAALALAALACLAAIIATRGLARRVAGLAMAGFGGWLVAMVIPPLHAATVLSAAAGQAAGATGGTLPGGNSAISGGSTGGGGLPGIGTATRAVLDSGPWRAAAVIGAAAVIAAGLIAAWHGPRWPVMSARFDRPARQGGQASRAAAVGVPVLAGGTRPDDQAMPAGQAGSDGQAGSAGQKHPADRPASAGQAGPAGRAGQDSAGPAAGEPGAVGAEAADRDRDAAALWEALDRGVDLTDSPDTEAGAEPAAAPARGDEQ